MTKTYRDGQQQGTAAKPAFNTGLTEEDFRKLESGYITRDLAIAPDSTAWTRATARSWSANSPARA